jgi:hypothetical protein
VKTSIAILCYCLLFINTISAQTTDADKADYTIAVYLNKINHLSQVKRDPDVESDSLILVNNQLMAYIQSIGNQPAILASALSRAEDAGMIMQTSEDKKIRFYAWDTWIDNAMHYFNLLAQYQAGNETKMLVLNDIAIRTNDLRDPGSYPTELDMIQNRDGKTIYMLSDCSVAPNNYKANGVKAYAIEDGIRKTVSFFETTGAPVDNIDYVFNATYDSTNFNPGIIHFSEDKKQLFVPYVTPNGKLSKDFLLYNFDGRKYVLNKKQRKMMEEK